MKINPFNRYQTANSWIVSVSLVLMAVGFMGALAFIGTGKASIKPGDSGISNISPETHSENTEETNKSLREEVAKLREEKSTLEKSLADGNTATKQINASLIEAKQFAGLTDLEGPGITVLLSDSKLGPEELLSLEGGIIHDADVLKVVNELWNAGAEAVSVNDLRVGPRSDFRCVGSTILIDGQRISAPVEIKAIGNPKQLNGALNMPGGILDEIRDVDEAMVKIEIVEKHFIKAFTGPTTFKYGKIPEKPTE